MRLTTLGEFVVKRTVVCPKELWATIFKILKDKLDGEDEGTECDEAWKFVLEELRSGCDELLENDKFLELVHKG